MDCTIYSIIVTTRFFKVIFISDGTPNLHIRWQGNTVLSGTIAQLSACFF